MTIQVAATRSTRLTKVVAGLALAGMALAAASIIASIVGYNGFALTDSRLADQQVMTLPVELNFPVDFGDRLVWVDGPDGGTIDQATGLGPVELSGPTTAQLGFWDPTTGQRTAWLLLQIAGPALAIAGLWQIYGMAKSAVTGDPFTLANEKRLWRLATLVAVGGSAYLWLAEVARAWIVAQSAASEFVNIAFTFSFLPITIGIAIAALAAIWHEGVKLREDVDGMI